MDAIEISGEARDWLMTFFPDDSEGRESAAPIFASLEPAGRPTYNLPMSQETHELLSECRETEWEAIDCAEVVDRDATAERLATVERILLDFEVV